MSSMTPHWWVLISTTSIYGSIVAAAVTTIGVSVIFFLKLWKTQNKSRDKGISISAQPATPRPQPVDYSAGDEGQLGIVSESVMSQTLPTTSESQFINQTARDESDPAISTPAQASTTQPPVDHSGGEEDQLGISVPSHAPLTTESDQDPKDKTVSIPAQASTTPQPHGDMGSEEVPSITLSRGSSNFQISETNATIIRNGNWQLPKIQRNLAWDYITNLDTLPIMNHNLKKHALIQSITALPRAEAGFNDYQIKKSGPCFKGTRVALLQEMANCVTGSSESRMYVLSGLAGIGKSTVAYTIASRAANLNLLGASFFFSREGADRNNAKIFFTTLAYQLCVYNETFAKAIGNVLNTKRGSAATMEDPQSQLEALILNPLRSIDQRSRPILIVVDALDECDEEGVSSVLSGLYKLVQDLPSFKVILTTRPQLYLDRFWRGQDGRKFFHLQDMEDKIVDGDIRLYLDHNLSMKQVQKCYPMQPWCASDEEIDYLVCAAGRFFIIASTAVRYILDKRASNPAAQMQKLLHRLRAFAQDHTDIDCFYTAILQDVVLDECDGDDIASRYQSVVGAIILVQPLLPVSTLSHLIDINVEETHAVLDKLQSVIFLGGDDVPHFYHKSFLDYLMDQSCCGDPHLRIDSRIRHTQIATRCFEIKGKYLKRNILGLGDLAQFMSNKDGLKKDGITDEQLQEKIPPQLRYACVYWVNHIEVANIEDEGLMDGLKRFADEHMLYWLEILSLIGKLDSAHRAISVVLELLTSTPSDLHQLLSDALRFISKFYEMIKRSALHTYYSALPFTPTDSLLYRRYNKEVVHNICRIEGGPEEWDALIANMSHGGRVGVVKFSLDNSLLVSCSGTRTVNNDDRCQEDLRLKVWDTVTGTPISTVSSDSFAVANNVSIASSEEKTITLSNVNRYTSSTMFTSETVYNLALSSESSRVAAVLGDGTVWLWDSGSAELIDQFDGYCGHWCRLEFSPTGTRLAYTSKDNIKLRDGISGRFIADLRCGPYHKFEFSADGSRMASLTTDIKTSIDDLADLALWNSESGGLIAAVCGIDPHYHLAISPNGSLLATVSEYSQVMLWSENLSGQLVQIKVLEADWYPSVLTFSLDKLAIATQYGITLYNIHTGFIAMLLFNGMPTALTFSPDCTRLAAGYRDGDVNLWNIQGIDSSPVLRIATLLLSRDCSRLACGFEDGTVELWGTSPAKRQIVSHQTHERSVRALGFGPDGGLFASGSDDGTIKLWNGEDGSLHGTLKVPSGLAAVALSNNVLVAAGGDNVTLWSLDTLSLVHTLKASTYGLWTMSIAENNALIAIACDLSVTLLDAENHRIITTFDVYKRIHTMTFLPGNLQLVAQSEDGAFLSLNLINKHITEVATLEHLIQPLNISLWHGVPIWHCLDKGYFPDKGQHYLTASFSQHKSPVPVLWIPRHISVTAWTQGASMIALGCWNGRVILLRLPTSHVG